LPGDSDPLQAFPDLQRWFHAIDSRPAVAKARAVGRGHAFKKEIDEETRRALFPSNYDKVAS
jgi:GST-like protein